MGKNLSGWITNKEVIAIKHIPNILTAARIFCSTILIFVIPFSALFFLFYILCGVSDILDGYIARKIKCDSSYGATFDSIADLFFIAILLVILIPIFPWSKWMLYWIGIIASIRFFSLAIGFIKYHTVTFLHTYANKATGAALFCFPFLYTFCSFQITTVLIGCIASLSAIEELIIIVTSKELDRNIKTICISSRL